MRRFRAALLALGVLVTVVGVALGVVGAQAVESRDNALRLAAASRSAAVGDYAGRARAIALVTSRSAAFASFYAAPGTRAERIRSQGVDPAVMERVNAALHDLELFFPDNLAQSAFTDRGGAVNAAVVRGYVQDPEDLDTDVRRTPWFRPALDLPYGSVHQTAPYRSPATGEWVVASAAKVDIGPGVSPAVVHFEVTVESIRLAMYDEDPEHRVRVVDLRSGAVVIDSTRPQDLDAPLGSPDDESMRWVPRVSDGATTSRDGMRHVVEHLEERGSVATSWAVVVSRPEPATAALRSFGPPAVVVLGVLLLAASTVGHHRQGRAMHRAARRDELTELHNRMSAREVAETVLAHGQGLTVMLIDLDRFKHVNDSLGHHAGDHLLAEVAHRLHEVLREPDDVVARLGGDEFVVLTGRLGDNEAVRAMCERLMGAITEPVDIDGLDVTVGASIGIATAPEHGTDYGTLLQHADIAMYDAKARRLGWEVYRPGLVPHERVDLTLDAELRTAVREDQLELVVQPTFDLRSGQVRRLECLVRWRHPGRGLLTPAQFIPYAEATGSIKLITRAVLGAALDEASTRREWGEEVTMAVNVSAHDVMDPHFADMVLEALAERGLPGSCLEIELTETALLTDPQAATTALSRLAAARVQVAVDDFGSGYASLLYLRRFPVTSLKLDRSLVQGLVTNPTDRALVKWTIEMAHALGIVCIAEGVEESETLAALAALGCDEAQGFLLQRPVPVRDFAPAVLAMPTA